MRKLVIDCATEGCSAALFDETGALVAGTFEMLGRGHAERLVPMIAELLDKGRTGTIAVDTGPGSFTGIRVGLAAARALSLAWNAPLAGYESLALVAAMAAAEYPGMDIDVAMTGGHGEWFVQSFDAGAAPLGALVSLKPEEAARRSGAPLVVGSQAEALAALRGGGVVARQMLPDARKFALLPADALSARVSPSYGRAPDARLPARG
ncbi:tRNA (adenosine(37)-N6)-threonylcarbamoyltransferase complex dimerization subunit type 1 TsaB [Novosphingobium sp. ZN18A2]|uniref:tRNA (adenosine(37)-N6)-threonylcarbamoyltransferase complex dimerization subunit type 1 TsaB n=1 Tax=Novosphingobium sp. ZN18A2 TaxID=3079861 RepID=UPI0030D4C66C